VVFTCEPRIGAALSAPYSRAFHRPGGGMCVAHTREQSVTWLA
jgi:hypothetical protein